MKTCFTKPEYNPSFEWRFIKQLKIYKKSFKIANHQEVCNQ